MNAKTETRADQTQGNEGAGNKAGWILLGIAALLAVASILYNVIGSEAGEPAASPTAQAGPSIEELRSRAEAEPDNADRWADLGFALYGQEDYAGAAEAYSRATQVDDDRAILWSALGEARLYAADRAQANADPMPPAALEAFKRAVDLDPTEPRARYFLAVKQDIDGDHDGAIESWLDLLADTPPGAPWEQNLVRTIRQVGQINEIEVEERVVAAMDGRMPSAMTGVPASGSTGLRGPTAEQMAQGGSLPPGEQRAMAEGMVAQLEARLENEPGNLDGWVMLMRSRMTLGEPQKASEALVKAIAANPEEEDELRRQAEMLGVG
jgi:cytochrome c-type biogenesis protein CcmH